MTTDKDYYESLILAEIDANLSKYLNFLASLVKCPSPNPPGDTRPAAHYVRNFLSLHDVQPTTIAPVAHMPNVVAEFNGSRGPGPRVVFNGHIDTLPANNAEDWHVNQSGFNDGTLIHGLGVVDMKAGVAASIVAFTLLKKWAALLTGSIALTVVSDEETGGVHGTKYLLEHCGTPSPWKGDFVINGGPGGLQSVRFGEKGK
jgi:acetylornithine deacetylase/succinyl-diaminopimelate desuccinylase-like protein